MPNGKNTHQQPRPAHPPEVQHQRVPEQSQPSSPAASTTRCKAAQPTVFDELQYAYSGLIACLRADDLLRVTLFAGILTQVSSKVQIRACQHLVNKASSVGAILPGLYEEIVVFAGMEGTTYE